MGWLKDLWNDILKEVKKLIQSAIGWLVEKIEDFTVWLKVTRHRFLKWLAEFLETDLGFWLALIGATLVIAGYALCIIYGYGAELKIYIENLLLIMKSYAGSFLEVIHYSEIHSLQQIAKIMIPAYRKLWEAFYKAMGALCEEIGLGVGTITCFMRNANTVILSTYTAIGYTPDEAEVIYMQESNAFFSRIDGRFERYARNPELIFQDINEEIVKPHLIAQGEQNYKMALFLDSLSTTVITIDANLLQLEKDVKKLISELPDEISDVIERRTDVFFKHIDDFHDDYIEPVLEG